MVMSGYQLMNLQFVHVSKSITPTFGKGSGIHKIPQKVVQVSPQTSQGNNICIVELL